MLLGTRLGNGSRVNREVYARFCGEAQGEIPWAYSPKILLEGLFGRREECGKLRGMIKLGWDYPSRTEIAQRRLTSIAVSIDSTD